MAKRHVVTENGVQIVEISQGDHQREVLAGRVRYDDDGVTILYNNDTATDLEAQAEIEYLQAQAEAERLHQIDDEDKFKQAFRKSRDLFRDEPEWVEGGITSLETRPEREAEIERQLIYIRDVLSQHFKMFRYINRGLDTEE